MTQAKVAVITGGTGALGSAIVARLLADGFACHVTWLLERELSHFSHGERVTRHQVDCADEMQTVGFYAKLGRVDASVHVVGGFAMAGLTETSLADFDRMHRLNAVTAFLCTREAVRAMRRSGHPGRIVNVAARPALNPVGGLVAYSTSKAAVASLTQCAAEEVRGEGILINAIVPSIMDTPTNRSAMPNADFTKWPKLEEVAETVGFLVGSRNTLTTATLVPVYGKSV